MLKIANVEQFTKDGKIWFRYDQKTLKGMQTIEEPLYFEDGSLNNELVNKLEKASSEKLKTNSSEKQDNTTKLTVYKNPNWFKKNKTAIIAGVSGILGGILIATGVSACSQMIDKENDNSNVRYEDPIGPELPKVEVKVEEAVKNISYEEVIEDCKVIGEFNRDNGYENISQRSTNALYYIVNASYINDKTTEELIENGVINETAMDIITDSLEALSVYMDQGCKSITNDSKNIVDLSQYCAQEEDKEIVKHIYNNLNKIEDYMEYVGKDNVSDRVEHKKENYKEIIENNQKLYVDFYRYMANDENTTYPYIYNDTTAGTNFLIGQIYAPIFNVAGSYNGIDSRITKSLEEGAMNDFSIVMKQLEGNCNTKTKDLTK